MLCGCCCCCVYIEIFVIGLYVSLYVWVWYEIAEESTQRELKRRRKRANKKSKKRRSTIRKIPPMAKPVTSYSTTTEPIYYGELNKYWTEMRKTAKKWFFFWLLLFFFIVFFWSNMKQVLYYAVCDGMVYERSVYGINVWVFKCLCECVCLCAGYYKCKRDSTQIGKKKLWRTHRASICSKWNAFCSMAYLSYFVVYLWKQFSCRLYEWFGIWIVPNPYQIVAIPWNVPGTIKKNRPKEPMLTIRKRERKN